MKLEVFILGRQKINQNDGTENRGNEERERIEKGRELRKIERKEETKGN